MRSSSNIECKIMASRALLVVPPFMKYSAGPLLGPALLQTAAESRGHVCRVVDLNARYIQPRASPRLVRGTFVGDHDKPKGIANLEAVQEDFLQGLVIPSLLQKQGEHFFSEQRDVRRAALFGMLTHQELSTAANELAATVSFGNWAASILGEEEHDQDVVGISLLHAGQVIPAAAVTTIARQLWPQALVVWGGPHVSGLGRRVLEQDAAQRSFAADAFVVGHAEKTFGDILDQHRALKEASVANPLVLDGESVTLAPKFSDLEWFDPPLVLPAQSTLGCAYGRCKFCTYPSIENFPQKLDLQIALSSVVEKAQSLEGASVSLKDSLVTATRLSEIGNCIGGRVKWSACTKLSRRLDFNRLTQLCADGLATLEVGLESLLPETQKRIDKIQPIELFEIFLQDVARVNDKASGEGISIVANYMVDFPWEKPFEAHEKLALAKHLLHTILGPERGSIELNHFELERQSPMAKFPEMYEIDTSKIRKWPWASVLDTNEM